MTSFETRYRRAAADPHLRRGLLDFQRSWRVSRDGQMAVLEGRSGSSFDELRREFAATKGPHARADGRIHRRVPRECGGCGSDRG